VRQPRLQGVSPRQNARTDGRRKRRLLSVQRQRAGFSERPRLHQLRTIPSGDSPSGRLWPGMAGANPSATNCPNDVAPQLAQNPFAKFVLSQMPTPSNPGHISTSIVRTAPGQRRHQRFYSRGVSNTDNATPSVSTISSTNSNQVFVRYTYIPVIAQRYFAFPISNPLQQVPSDESFARNVAIGYTHLFSDQLVSSFHFGYMRNLQNCTGHGPRRTG